MNTILLRNNTTNAKERHLELELGFVDHTKYCSVLYYMPFQQLEREPWPDIILMLWLLSNRPRDRENWKSLLYPEATY